MKSLFAKKSPIPGWLFLIGMSLYVELLLFIWTADAFVLGRLAAIGVFALAFGCCLGMITSLFSEKAEKWAAVILGALLGVLCLLEFFIHDAFSVFMPLISVFATAEGVATGYTQIILSLVGRNLWRIALVLLPVVLFAVFSEGNPRGWKRSAILAVCAAVLYGGGIGLVRPGTGRTLSENPLR